MEAPKPVPGEPGRLTKDYLVSPFDVFDGNMSTWQARKRQWRSFGMVGEIGRDDAVHGKNWEKPDYMKKYGRKHTAVATSIFDPHLTEVLTLWFTNPGDRIFDPFAGGPPRGAVTTLLKRVYAGIELRSPQVEANQKNFEEIERLWTEKGGDTDFVRPCWITGDSTKATDLISPDYDCDFVLTCPPYGDLEVYSDDPADLSTMPYPAFLDLYEISLQHAVNFLNENRFFAIVVGEFRDPDGGFRNFVGDTAAILKKLGLVYLNEMILVTPRNTAPLRTRGFEVSRKVVRLHQNILVFVKGDARAAADRLVKPIAPIYNLSRFQRGEKGFFG